MKRFLCFGLIFCILFAFKAPAARANSWGLTGELYRAVASVHTWDDYSAISSQVGSTAVMHNRYHNALMQVENGALRVYTRAVYQPGNTPEIKVELKKSAGGFTMTYGKEEAYEFFVSDGEYILKSAKIGSFQMNYVQSDVWNRYIASDKTGEAVCQRTFLLSEFNISLFPRSVDEVKALNLLYAALDSGSDCLSYTSYPAEPGNRRFNVAKGTAAVYSAPFGASAWRAAKGKAAVGLSGEFWVLRLFQNADGDRYAAIRYNVSERTQRIGFVRADALCEAGAGDPVSELISVQVRTKEETYVTDDPDVSQFAHMSVPKGAQLDCIGLYGNDYALVSAEVKNGKLTDGGAILWGFIPLKSLELDDLFSGALRQDVMASLAGEWEFYSGGNMAEDSLTLNADGTYTAVYNIDEMTGQKLTGGGQWQVTEYHPRCNLYWNDPPYELRLTNDDGCVNIKGLSLNENGFSLTNWEGGGGYARATGESN